MIIPVNKYEYKLSNLTFNNCINIIGDNLHLFNQSAAECSTRFKHCNDNTPFLFSYGGSGNTVTRIIIAYITNIYTGSIYPRAFFPRKRVSIQIYQKSYRFWGEGHCGRKTQNDVVVIKAHPEHLNRTKLVSLFAGNCTIFDCVCGKTKREQTRIRRSKNKQNILFQKNHFKTYYFNGIFIVRNPWNAMWALYQFYFGSGCSTYIDVAASLNHIYSNPIHLYHCNISQNGIWNKTHFAQNLVYGKISYNKWLKTFELMELFEKYNMKYIVVKFENLVNLKEPLIAINEMNKITKYLYLNDYYKTNRLELMQRMECLAILMEKSWKRFDMAHRSKPDPEKHQISIHEAYMSVNDEIICNIWSQIQHYAINYGYDIWNNTNCQLLHHII